MNNKMKIAIVLISIVIFMGACQGPQMSNKKCPCPYKGWMLGVQAWTFHKVTFYETVDNSAALGLKFIEVYPGQKFSKEKPNEKFGHMMSAELRREAKQKLAEAGIKPIVYGVLDKPQTEAQWREIFDFAKEMGIETIGIQQTNKALDQVEKLCDEYKINAALHNHPKPSPYWNPDQILKVCKGRSNRIGANADVGHWARSGLNPVECLKKLQGRIISVHLKDIDQFGNVNAEDVVFGKGKVNIKAVLTELDRQGYKGFFAIEHEHEIEDKMPEVRQCAEYFNKVAGCLASKK